MASKNILFLALLLAGYAHATRIRLYNACPFAIWPAWVPNAGFPQLSTGGTKLVAWQSFDVYASSNWAGRFWGRTNCSFNYDTDLGSCETGDCGGRFGCITGGNPPATLVEYTPLHKDNIDYYDVSVVDGYNLPIRVSTTNPACSTIGCHSDVNVNCPSELATRDRGGNVIACKSACLAFERDYYCCTNEYSSAETCHANEYTNKFKYSCPTAKTYRYDTVSSAFTCPSGADYTITFCPSGGSNVLSLPSEPEEI